MALTKYAHQQIEAADDFEACHVPQCNILVFRHRPPAMTDLTLQEQNRFQQQLRTTLIQSGEFYIVQTKLQGTVCLRLTVMNPTTQESDLDDLLNSIRKIAANFT